jgi:hypothetical protein
MANWLTTKRPPEARLPDEPPRTSTARAAAGTFGLAVLLVVAANLLTARAIEPPYLSPDRRIIGEKFNLLAERSADVVVVGDSSAAFGIDAEILSEELGRTASNLATFGRFEPAGAAWTLDAYIEAHGPPEVAIVMLGARTWWLEAGGLDLAVLPLEAGYWRRREPTRSLPLRELGLFALARWVPLYVQHQVIARGVRTGRFGVPEQPAIAADGTMALGEEEARWANPRAYLDKTVAPELATSRVPLRPEARAALEVLARRADADGFDLVLAQAPYWEALDELPAHAAVVAEVDTFLRSLAEGSPRVHVLSGAPRRYPTEAVENPYHLLAGPAREFTRTFAGEVRALLEGR